MKITRVRVRRVGEGEDAARWAEALADAAWQSESRILKQDGGSWVRRAVIAGREVVIKCRPVEGFGETVKRLGRATRGDRHWRGAQWLSANGFATAAPFVLANAEVDGRACELLATEYIEARSVLDHLAARDLSVRDEHAVARALARLVRDMGLKSRYNRDGKPSNLLLLRDAEGQFRIATIDAVAIRRGRSFPLFARSLANLVIEPMGTKSAPRLALCMRVVREFVGPPPSDADERDDWWLTRAFYWKKPQEIIDAHGDPTPRVDPLK